LLPPRLAPARDYYVRCLQGQPPSRRQYVPDRSIPAALVAERRVRFIHVGRARSRWLVLGRWSCTAAKEIAGGHCGGDVREVVQVVGRRGSRACLQCWASFRRNAAAM